MYPFCAVYRAEASLLSPLNESSLSLSLLGVEVAIFRKLNNVFKVEILRATYTSSIQSTRNGSE